MTNAYGAVWRVPADFLAPLERVTQRDAGHHRPDAADMYSAFRVPGSALEGEGVCE